MASAEFLQFLNTLKTGDAQAVEAMLCELDPFLRRIIRLRLVDGRLRRVLDTTDIFDSLVKDFLARKETPSDTGAAPGELRAYLAAAVHHKIATRARKERRHAGSLPSGWEIADPAAEPARRVEAEDFHHAVRARLSADAQRLFDLKTQGLSWNQIAGHVGALPDALRMRLTRAVAAALGGLGSQGADVERC